jgi:hypothetical protein
MPRIDEEPVTIDTLRLYWSTHQQARDYQALPADVQQRIAQHIEGGAIAPAAAIAEETKKIQRDPRLTDVGRREAIARLRETHRPAPAALRTAADTATKRAADLRQAALRGLAPLASAPGSFAFRDELEPKDVASVLRRELRAQEIRAVARERAAADAGVTLAGDYLSAVEDPAPAAQEFVRALEDGPFTGGRQLLPAATLDAGQAARLANSPMAGAIALAETEASTLAFFATLAERALVTVAEGSADTMSSFR